MAEPLSTAILIATKNFIMDLFSEPEKIIKSIVVFIFGPILILMLLFIVPMALLLNAPSILLDGGSSPEITIKQNEVIAIYKEAPNSIRQSNLNWIEDKKREYSWCDDLNIIYNADLFWEELIAIDSVLLEQDFNNVNKSDVINLGERFIIRDAYTKNYEIEEEYEEQEEYIVIIKGENGKEIKEKRKRTVINTRTVTQTRAIISVTSKSFENVLTELDFEPFQKEVVQNILNTTISGF